MTMGILANHVFTLSIQETWDSYEEVKVKFVEQISVVGFSYYIFSDVNKTYYYLSPRSVNDQLEGIFVKKKILVNLSKFVSVVQEKNCLALYAIGELVFEG